MVNTRELDRVFNTKCLSYIYENLIKFQVQSIYFIYTRLIVHTTLDLVYSKEYISFIRSIYYIILEIFISFCVIYDHVTVTVTCDRYVTQCHIVWQFIISICNIMLILTLKIRNKMKINRVHYLQCWYLY